MANGLFLNPSPPPPPSSCPVTGVRLLGVAWPKREREGRGGGKARGRQKEFRRYSYISPRAYQPADWDREGAADELGRKWRPTSSRSKGSPSMVDELVSSLAALLECNRKGGLGVERFKSFLYTEFFTAWPKPMRRSPPKISFQRSKILQHHHSVSKSTFREILQLSRYLRVRT